MARGGTRTRAVQGRMRRLADEERAGRRRMDELRREIGAKPARGGRPVRRTLKVERRRARRQVLAWLVALAVVVGLCVLAMQRTRDWRGWPGAAVGP